MRQTINPVKSVDITHNVVKGERSDFMATTLTMKTTGEDVEVVLFSDGTDPLPIEDLRGTFHANVAKAAEQTTQVNYADFHELIVEASKAVETLRAHGFLGTASYLRYAILKVQCGF